MEFYDSIKRSTGGVLLTLMYREIHCSSRCSQLYVSCWYRMILMWGFVVGFFIIYSNANCAHSGLLQKAGFLNGRQTCGYGQKTSAYKKDVKQDRSWDWTLQCFTCHRHPVTVQPVYHYPLSSIIEPFFFFFQSILLDCNNLTKIMWEMVLKVLS